VNVVSVGIVREDEIIHSYAQAEAGSVGYDIIIVGKPTDKSGFGGASFASLTIKEEDSEQNAGAVQEPNPFLERHLLASTYSLFDWIVREGKLDKVSFKDLGAGGNVCASVEQVAAVGMGAVVDLDKIHTALPDLPPQVIACAETQERFCWICHPSLTDHILHHYNKVWDLPSVAEGARASVVGKVTTGDTFTLLYKGKPVCSARSEDITSGLQYKRPTKAPTLTFVEPDIQYSGDTVSLDGKKLSLQTIAEAMLSHPTHASKSRVFRHYDKNILGNTMIEPGEADASVIMPLEDLQSYEVDGKHPDWMESLVDSDRYVGVALASGGNGRYGRISPYLQGVNAVVENVRNVAAVGALPRAITDCLNYGNPEIPEQLWALEEGVRGIADAAKGLTFDHEPIPVISGNVSLYNATEDGPIDPTANVCIIGHMPDARRAINMQLKTPDAAIFFIGERKDECGGSAYYQILEDLLDASLNAYLGTKVPSPDLRTALLESTFIAQAIRSGQILAAHDVSDGGLFLALFEMTLPIRRKGGSIGLNVDLASIAGKLRTDIALFSETGGFIIEVAPNYIRSIEAAAERSGISLKRIGSTTSKPQLSICLGKLPLIEGSLEKLRSRWSISQQEALGTL
jgi:phosphoribosylformylglycinamidine synthase